MQFTKDDLDLSPSIVFHNYESPLTPYQVNQVERAFFIFMDQPDITPNIINEIFDMNTDEIKRLLVLGHVTILIEQTTLIQQVADPLTMPIITEEEEEDEDDEKATHTMTLHLAIERFIQSVKTCFPNEVLPAFPSEGGDLLDFLDQFTVVQLIMASW